MTCDRKIGPYPCCSVVQGDCLELMKALPDGCVDAVICDLPYGTTDCKWDAVIPFAQLWAFYRRITRLDSVIALNASQPFTSALVMSAPSLFKYEWIWKKNAGSNFGTTKFQPMKEHESILIFYREFGIYNAQMEPRSATGKAMVSAGVKSRKPDGKGVYSGGQIDKGYDNSKQDPSLRVPSSVQLFNRERGLHPTQKPTALMEYLVKTYTNSGGAILDNCAGSGTTLVAAKKLGRHFLGFEISPIYAQLSRDRLAAIDAQPSLFEQKPQQLGLLQEVEAPTAASRARARGNGDRQQQDCSEHEPVASLQSSESGGCDEPR